MNINSSLLKRSAALLAGLVLAATTVSAQPASKPASPKKSPYGFEIRDGSLLLPDGKKTDATLENVVELLRELELARNGDPANIVLSPDLPKIKIANLKLAATTLTQELEALRVASGERFTWSTGEIPFAMIDPTTGLAVSLPPDQMPLPLYILRPAPESGHGRLRVEAFSLAGYFESKRKGGDENAYRQMIEQEINQIEEIVAETAEIYADLNRQPSGGEAAGRSGPSLRFHRGANLLVVMGEPEAVEIAAKVIGALPHVQRSGSDAPGGFGGRRGPVSGFPDSTSNRYGTRDETLPQTGADVPPARR